jgi:hypothetical protein
MSSSFIITSAVLFFSGIFNWIRYVNFILTLYVSIITSEQCQQCQVKTLGSIETKSTPFNIPRSNDPSIIVVLRNPSVHITGSVQEQRTMAGNLSFIFYFLNRILNKKKRKILNVFFLSFVFVDLLNILKISETVKITYY